MLPLVTDGSFQRFYLGNFVCLQVGSSLTYAEKLVAGKMSRGQYMDLEQATNAKKEDIFNKIELLLNML